MAWGTVKLWIAGKQGAKISTLLNAQLRDKMDVLDQHKHTGVEGEGAAELSGIAKVTLANVGAASGAGELKRNGTDLTWGPAGYVITNIDPAVGTGGLRTLGTGAQQAAAGDHGH